jgi:hypothetical protein
MKSQRLAGVVMWGMVMGLADPVGAATLRYRLGGPWEAVNTDGVSNGWGLNPNLAGTSVPGSGDEARVNFAGNTVTVAYAAPTFATLRVGVDESGKVVVQDNGVLTTTGEMHIGNNGAAATGTMVVNDGGTVACGTILWVGRAAATTGVLTIDSGGVVGAGNHLWWGYQGNATINISGTLAQTGGNFGLGTNNASAAGGGVATLNILNGGIVNLNQWAAWNSGASTGSIHAGSLINMLGGTLTIKGNRESEVDAYVTLGRIVGYGGSGTIERSYDSGTNLTTITAIPEPGSFALLGMAGLVSVVVRRRKLVA